MTAFVPVEAPPPWVSPAAVRPDWRDRLYALVSLHAHRLARGELSLDQANAALLAATCAVAHDVINAPGAPNPKPIETFGEAGAVLGRAALVDVVHAADEAGTVLTAHGFEVAQA